MRSACVLAFAFLVAGCARHPETFRNAATTEAVSFAAGKEKGQGFVARPAGAGPFPAVLLIHDDFGLTDPVKGQARRLADAGFVALAIDLYRGEKAADVMDAHVIGSRLSQEGARADLKGALDYLQSRPDVRREALGVLGWELGGGYALDAAIADRRLRAVVVCYGRLTTDPTLLRPLRASVLGVFAGRDEGISPRTLDDFKAAMGRAGKRLAGLHVYQDCDTGFLTAPAGSLTPAARQASADAWKKIDEYLAEERKR
jgi:carboxymethylenebutenolidase